MFSGIVACVGTVSCSTAYVGGDLTLTIVLPPSLTLPHKGGGDKTDPLALLGEGKQNCPPSPCGRGLGGGVDERLHLSKDIALGDSIAIDGACLTVTARTEDTFSADLSCETLSKTHFASLKVGDKVNLEKALTLQTLLNGHLVTGHVDEIGEVISKNPSGRSETFEIAIPKNLMRYMAQKGSVCLDGVSLTINALSNRGIKINCIPQTLTQTTLGAWQVGRKMHVEVDIIARYVERFLVPPFEKGGLGGI